MATAGSAGCGDLQKDLICGICLDFFDEPVILKCGHNFCSFCILVHWEENGGEDVGYQCPECRMNFSKVSFTKNYLVRNLVDKLKYTLKAPKQPVPSKPVKLDGKCGPHGEQLKLYCHTDHKPICVVCRESRAHRHHDVAPVSEVLDDMKAKLKLRLCDLYSQKAVCNNLKATDEKTKDATKLNKRSLKEKIEAEVMGLVQFLLDEKDELLECLDAEEVATMTLIDENIKTVETEAAAVDKAVAEIESHIGGTTSFESVTHTYNNPLQVKALRSCKLTPDWTDFSGPFGLIMWKKMMQVLHTVPKNLTLDLDTAHPHLAISEFNTQVEETQLRSCQEPDLPQRFNRFCGVLATAQYSSGQHYWEVDVRDKGVWYLGVTSQSSNRKGFVNLRPSAGYWSLCLQDLVYACQEDARVYVADSWNSPRVGVYLDYDNGRVSFYDAVTMKKVYMFEAYFDEPVSPFFSPGKNDIGTRLQICHYY